MFPEKKLKSLPEIQLVQTQQDKIWLHDQTALVWCFRTRNRARFPTQPCLHQTTANVTLTKQKSLGLTFWERNSSVPVLPRCSVNELLKSTEPSLTSRPELSFSPQGLRSLFPGRKSHQLQGRRWRDNEINSFAFLSNLSIILPYLTSCSLDSLRGEMQNRHSTQFSVIRKVHAKGRNNLLVAVQGIWTWGNGCTAVLWAPMFWTL